MPGLKGEKSPELPSRPSPCRLSTPCFGSGATTVILAIRLDRADIRAGHSDPTRTRVTQAAKTPALSPPLAPRRPHSTTLHGITISDDYAWLKDANWQDV